MCLGVATYLLKCGHHPFGVVDYMTDEAWKNLEKWVECNADAGEDHLSLVDWFFYLVGGQGADRNREELAAHIDGCKECADILKEQQELRVATHPSKCGRS